MNEIKILNGQGKLVTRRLWEKIFTEDSEKFLDYYYKYKCRHNVVYVIEKGGEPVSMLQCNPCRLKAGVQIIRSDYIVGVATDENFRRQGLMARLLKTSLNDMAEQGREFTFLMPAAEAIYTPFGFRFIYSQPVYRTGKHSGMINCNNSYCIDIRPLERDGFDTIVNIINRHLEDSYDLFSLKTREYFEDLKEQYNSDDGDICCVYMGGKFAAYFSWWPADEGAEITELICINQNREKIIAGIYNYFYKTYKIRNIIVRGEITGECQTENRIMARITNVRSMLKLIRADKKLRIKLNISDGIIPKNNKAFIWNVSETQSDVKETLDKDAAIKSKAFKGYHLKAASYDTELADCELNISIEALTLWLFSGVVPDSNPDLKYIRTLNRVFINEIV